MRLGRLVAAGEVWRGSPLEEPGEGGREGGEGTVRKEGGVRMRGRKGGERGKRVTRCTHQTAKNEHNKIVLDY